ncbi:16S rRNA (cytosine(1402)-N(4))-methyltransferase RsmH [Sulfurospirillum diekertiae]|uniref:Ribosomal RNA small subunit methyltransferase H n=1 Tax=Sulfurospirillum diekertiae TaxID=1854492 RepID=A0A6G9VQ04_9BACT|nr:16S rRNA (cytosine(1402)-N(4))-methyltransferase RsmH [Sulfurospirillum diekertiae]QIR74963.1 16S rRNA (cytosine(1402)-N(4))-methyltransferase RsmH [Sulfurospirillum diekertiae]QIR77627.1 16S rRNA (cytosine(1402)-N(4))-methyltransferase RsmH [Sulfurospirillum diekertiae]
MNIPHIPVLLEEVKEAFCGIDDGVVIDCTLGYGGHSEALLEQNPNIKLIGCDQDEEALAFSQKRLERFNDRVTLHHGNFASVIAQYAHLPIRGILADIGVSSLQLDKKERGFAFDSDVLDMRMNPKQELSAYEVVNHYSQEELEFILCEYGEIHEYKKMAHLICAARAKAPIVSAKELSKLAEKVGGKKSIHPSTLLFQAIRIEVNNELGVLSELLESIKNADFKQCIVGIISFHSLEDRIVKQTFKLWSQNCICLPSVMRCTCGNNHSMGKLISKKPIEATASEIKKNPRSRSAKLRVFEIKKA